jgi:predicted DNA binding CopG/RHH family protein
MPRKKENRRKLDFGPPDADFQLDDVEKEILKNLDLKKLKKPSTKRKKEVQQIARNTLRALKTERMNIRLDSETVNHLKQEARENGLPYQTYIAHMLFLVARKKLVKAA